MKTRVFISSTGDLRGYREIARETVRAIGHDPVLWDDADFQEVGGTTEQKCLKNVESCQVLLAIVGINPGSPSSIAMWTVFQREVIHAMALRMAVIVCYTKDLGDAFRSNSDKIDKRVLNFDKYLKARHVIFHEVNEQSHFETIIKNKLSEALRNSLEGQKKPKPDLLKNDTKSQSGSIFSSLFEPASKGSSEIPKLKRSKDNPFAKPGQDLATNKSEGTDGLFEAILKMPSQQNKPIPKPGSNSALRDYLAAVERNRNNKLI